MFDCLCVCVGMTVIIFECVCVRERERDDQNVRGIFPKVIYLPEMKNNPKFIFQQLPFWSIHFARLCFQVF